MVPYKLLSAFNFTVQNSRQSMYWLPYRSCSAALFWCAQFLMKHAPITDTLQIAQCCTLFCCAKFFIKHALIIGTLQIALGWNGGHNFFKAVQLKYCTREWCVVWLSRCTVILAVMSPPSRILPQRAWAAAVPTLLSHDGLTKLLTASMLPGHTQFLPASPLERFFACIHLRRHMQRVIQSETPVSLGGGGGE